MTSQNPCNFLEMICFECSTVNLTYELNNPIENIREALTVMNFWNEQPMSEIHHCRRDMAVVQNCSTFQKLSGFL